MNPVALLRKGLREPARVPPFVLGRLLPGSRWGPEWYRENGYVTFEDGGFAGGSPGRPELSARLFYETRSIARVLGDRRFERSLEVGCGYGRLSGWFARRAGEAVAVEPNREAVRAARRLYPGIAFERAVVERLPFAADSFDLAVTWLVLTHVEPSVVGDAAAELTRVLAPGGTLLVCEQTRGEPGSATWPRSVARYDSLFDPWSVVRVAERGVEPTFAYGDRMEVLLLER